MQVQSSDLKRINQPMSGPNSGFADNASVTVDEGDPHFQKFREASNKVDELLQNPASTRQAVMTAMENEETAFYLMKHNQEKAAQANVDSGGESAVFNEETNRIEEEAFLARQASIMQLLDSASDNTMPLNSFSMAVSGAESVSAKSGNISDHWDKIFAPNEKDMANRTDSLAKMQGLVKAMMELLDLISRTNKPDGENTGVQVQFKEVVIKLNALMKEFHSEASATHVFTSTKTGPEGLEEAKKMAEKLGYDPTNTSYIVNNPDGTYSLRADTRPLLAIQQTLLAMQANQKDGYLTMDQYNKMMNSIDSAFKDAESSVNKAAQLTVNGKEQLAALSKQLSAMMAAYADMLKMLTSHF